MNVLILTGTMAYDLIKEYTKPFADRVKIIQLPISIAAFVTPQLVINELKQIDLSELAIQQIIVPGLMQGSTQPIEDTLGVPTFKGPRYAADIPLIFDKSLQLSKVIPADKLYLSRGIEEYNDLIKKISKAPPTHPYIPLNSHRIGIDYPPLILAEIVDAPKLSIQQIISKGRYFLKNGAHLLDIGAIAGQNNAKYLGKIVEEVKATLNVPVSIDSLLPEEIEIGVEAGADLILSLDAGNIEELQNLPKDRIYTLIPTNVKQGIFPKSPENRVKLLIDNIKYAKKFGFEKILVDPLLESPISPGLMKSLETFILFRKKDAQVPLLFGAGNVSELMDADSPGINALLACIAIELGVSVILTTEYSNKTRKSIDELSTAIKMAFFANSKKSPPSGLPFNLLRAKTKKRYDQVSFDQPRESILVTEFEDTYSPDPKGYFKIWVDYENHVISVLHYPNSQNSQPDILLQGVSAEALGKKIISLNLFQDPNHIIYLGRELERAEIALFLGKNYVQDIKFEEAS